jgi:hypothetical protein
MKFVVALVFACVTTFAVAQKNIPALERQVTLTIYNEPVRSVLDKISTQCGVTFSYNPATVKVDKKVSFVASKKPLRSLLNQLFDENVLIKSNGNYIILTYKAPKPTGKAEPVKSIFINGYIYSNEGQAINAASVYNTDNLLATVSDEYGYYKLSVPANRLPLTLKVAKENYTDTSVRIEPAKTTCDIILTTPHPPKKTEPVEVETVTHKNTPDTLPSVIADTTQIINADTASKTPVFTFLQNLVLSDKLKSSIRNIKDTAFRTTQVSLVPYVSTNKLLSGNTVNDYSFNILVGYSQGVNRFELGGLMNIDRGDVKFMQAAGLFNTVGGSVTGVQLAGIGNMTKGRSDGLVAAGILNMGTHLHGIQLAGIVNINISVPDTLRNSKLTDFLQDTVKGIQLAGVTNINAGYTEGVRLAGTFNMGHSNKGVQIASLMNVNMGKSTGVNITWGLNYMHDTLIGYNIVGVANVNRKFVEGAQIAGLINIAEGDVKGLQATTILNIARHVNGTQIALLNFSDSSHGLPIGLISFVKNGYHKLEVFGDDVIYTQLAYRTGVPAFHNIFTVGFDLTRKYDGLWNLGYGIGSNIPINSQWGFTTDLIAQTLVHKGNFQDAPLLGNLFAGVERKLSPNFSIALGPVYHALINFNTPNMYSDISSQLVPYSISQTTYANGNTLHMWIGGKISVRFL